MRKIIIPAIVLTFAAVLAFATPASAPALETVSHVDLARYTGRWYEIARYPTVFERKCDRDVTAEYSTKPDGDIRVVNSCVTKDGSITKTEGTAVVVDKSTNAKLKVTFFWPFYGKYWIIGLGPNYEYAVVGNPDRDYLWILSRTPTLPQPTYDQILANIAQHSYDVSKLVKTTQTTTTNLPQ
jgi:apolipoprotein D and lipocalin family protein